MSKSCMIESLENRTMFSYAPAHAGAATYHLTVENAGGLLTALGTFVEQTTTTTYSVNNGDHGTYTYHKVSKTFAVFTLDDAFAGKEMGYLDWTSAKGGTYVVVATAGGFQFGTFRT